MAQRYVITFPDYPFDDPLDGAVGPFDTPEEARAFIEWLDTNGHQEAVDADILHLDKPSKWVRPRKRVKPRKWFEA